MPAEAMAFGPGFVKMFEMIGRQGAILRGERGAMLVRELLGVEADAQAVVRGGLEDALDLFGSEGDGFAKGVDAGRDALLGRRRNQLVDDLADIMGAAILLVGGQRMEGEQGGTSRTASPSPSPPAILRIRSSLSGSSP